MRTLDAEQLRGHRARGAAILGTGGRGDPYLGMLAALRVFEQYGPPTVLDPSELDDDALVALPVMVGAPVPLVEKLSFGQELDTVFKALGRYLEGKIEMSELPFSTIDRNDGEMAVASATSVSERPSRSRSARRFLPSIAGGMG